MPTASTPLRALLAGLALATTALSFPAAAQQDWPTRPIRLVNPASPGGTADALTRLVAEKMAQELGQPVLLDFRAGANGIIGNDHVAKSAPDGYTLLLCNSAMLANAALNPRLPYDTRKDFAPVAHFFETPYFLIAHAALPAGSVKELLELARRSPGKISFSSSGVGSTPHLTGEKLAQMAGVPLLHVPYKGSAPAVMAVVGNEANFLFMSLPATRSFIDERRLKVLATTQGERSSFLPDAPTMAEAGVPGLVASAWFGVCAPAATPMAVQERIAASLGRALSAPDVRERFEAAGAVPLARSSPAAFRAFFEKSLEETAAVIKASGAKLD